MQLYVYLLSPNCRRAIATAKYLKSPVEIKAMEPMQGEAEKPEFLALNPNGMCPTLVDGDFNLWESNAICQYLADKAGDEKFYPREAKARADINRWLFWEIRHFNKELDTVTYERLIKPMFKKEATDTVVANNAENAWKRFAKVLDNHLADRKFIMGDDVTIADFSVGKGLHYAEMANVDIKPFPQIVKWYARLNEIPAWVESAPPAMGQ